MDPSHRECLAVGSVGSKIETSGPKSGPCIVLTLLSRKAVSTGPVDRYNLDKAEVGRLNLIPVRIQRSLNCGGALLSTQVIGSDCIRRFGGQVKAAHNDDSMIPTRALGFTNVSCTE
jgi:hypothetical protein